MPVFTQAAGKLEPIATASRNELLELQLQRQQAALAHACENVPHYRLAFDAASAHLSDCRSLANPAEFPFTPKADLRAR